MLRRLTWMTVFSGAFALSLTAQTPDTATVHGQVLDQSQATVAGVRVRVRNQLSGLERTALTDSSGAFSIAGLPVTGRYDIAAHKDGFTETLLKDIGLSGGTTADFSLELNASGGQTQVIVTGIVGEVRTDEPQLGSRLGADRAEATPLPGRKISYLPLLNAANRPAINQGDIFVNQNLFTTNGAGRRQTTFEVDGSTGNDSWGRQTLFSAIPLTALHEMTVLVSEFSAEYGGSTGSAVNIVTKSGGKHFHAELMELWRPAATESALSGFTPATATNGNQVTSDTLGQTSLGLSGPVGGGGRTQFFASAEYSRQDRASPVTSPIAPGSYVGHYRGWLAFFRLDHQINANNNLFFRSNVDGFHDTNPNGTVGGNTLPTVARVFRRRTYSEELGETAVLSSSLVNNVRVQFQLASPITQFDPVIYGTQFQVPISTGGTFTTGTSQSAMLLNRQYQMSDTLAAAWGPHQIKFGAGAIFAHNGGDSKEFGGGRFFSDSFYSTPARSHYWLARAPPTSMTSRTSGATPRATAMGTTRSTTHSGPCLFRTTTVCVRTLR